MATVLVIGAAGMLGREVARAAELLGANVLRTGRAPRVGWKTFDVLADDAETLFEKGVGLIVNCAAVLAGDIEQSSEAVIAAERVNAEFPQRLAELAAPRGVRLLHISTDAVFEPDAGPCDEDSPALASDVYGRTKRLGEPNEETALTLRCSFVGRDPARRRGLLEWVLAQPAGATVEGYTDQIWNGLATVQVAAICAALCDEALFARARAEGPVQHLFEDPALTKRDLLVLCARLARKEVTVLPRASNRPLTRVLATRHAVLKECLESFPRRADALAELVRRSEHDDG
jgi:dTDP-4-dehydrorhamnose reductase